MPVRRRAALLALALLIAGLVQVGSGPPAHAVGTLTVTMEGRGQVTGAGLDCVSGTGTCSVRVPDDRREVCDDVGGKPLCYFVSEPRTVTLTASARDGYLFQEWTGCQSVSGSTCTVTMDADRTPQVRFRDVTAPVVVSTTPSGPITGTVTVAAAVTDNSGGLGFVQFQHGGAQLIARDTDAPYSATFDTTQFPDGARLLEVWARDAAGNSGFGTSPVVIDNSVPALEVTSGPDGETFLDGTSQTWAFEASDLQGDEHYLDVACSVVPAGSPPSFSTCSGGTVSHTASGLPGGSYEFVVRARNDAGLETAETRAFTVDSAPVTAVVSGPAHGSRLRTRTVRFGFASNEPGTFGCRVTPAGVTPPDFAPCSATSTHTATGMADGTYVFSVRATDTIGNVDASPVDRRFTIDTVAPGTAIRSGPSGVVRVPGRTTRSVFSLASERYAKFRCKLDRQRWKSCSSRPAFVVGLGAHVLQVAAVDLAGNVDRTPAVRRWTVRRR